MSPIDVILWACAALLVAAVGIAILVLVALALVVVVTLVRDAFQARVDHAKAKRTWDGAMANSTVSHIVRGGGTDAP